MKHYQPEEWIDYVNSTIQNQDQRQAMTLHLEKGCVVCIELHSLWRRVAETAKREREYEIPQSILNHVKRAFLIEQKRKGAAPLIPRLSFDSFWNPLPLGARSSFSHERALLFQTGKVRIHLRIESKTEPEMIWIDGQLSDDSEETRLFDEIPISLLKGDVNICQTKTNRFGEFHLDCKSSQNVELYVGVAMEETIVIPLADLSPNLSGE